MIKNKQVINLFYPFIKYCLVGALGTFIDLIIVWLLVEFANFHPVFAAFFGFLVAVTNNFIFNKNWTFKNSSKNYRKLWIKFLLVSSVGLLMTLLIMYVLVEIFVIYYLLAKVLTSGVVLIWNFLVNKMWTFRIEDNEFNAPNNYLFDLSIVIPSYNEEKRLPDTLIKMIDFFQNKKNFKVEFIVIDDGSSDQTFEVIQKMKKNFQNIDIIKHSKNRGKGAAVQSGVLIANGKYILMADADNSTPIDEYDKLQKAIEGKDIAIGSRYITNSNVEKKQSQLRIFIGRFGNSIIRFFLIDDIMDTQCGFKLFRHTVAKKIFMKQKITRFGFDIEALVVAQSFDYQIIEVPVRWINSEDSRFRPLRDTLITFFDLLYIKINLWSGRYK